MAGAKKSKNSRTTATPGQAKAQLVGDVRLIIPCNQGKNAYVLDVATGANPNVATDSDKFVSVVSANTAAGFGAKQRAELEALAALRPGHGWDGVLARLDEAGALA